MSILIVDDSKFQRAATKAALQNSGYADVLLSGSMEEALATLDGPAGIDLILLDIEMPAIDGIEGCRLIKSREALKDLPVIMVTGRDDPNTLKEAFDAGAMDFITKTASPVEVDARVRSALHLKREMDRRKAKERELLDLTQKLTSANQMLRDLAVVDQLTQIPNRRYFDEVIGREWKRARRESHPLALIMIDIDYFKKYNDEYGHGQGDQCLRQVAKALFDCTKRPGDSVARYGGEEFTAVLAGTQSAGAMELAEAMRTAVEDLNIPHIRSDISGVVTISLGVACLIPTRESTEERLLLLADEALYRAKANGRNQVAGDQP